MSKPNFLDTFFIKKHESGEDVYTPKLMDKTFTNKLIRDCGDDLELYNSKRHDLFIDYSNSETLLSNIYDSIIEQINSVTLVSFHYRFESIQSDSDISHSWENTPKYRINKWGLKSMQFDSIIKDFNDIIIKREEEYSLEDNKLTGITIRLLTQEFSRSNAPNNFNVVYRSGGNSTFIELPGPLKRMKSLLNIKNKDNQCFMWSILALIYPVEKNANKVSSYKHAVNNINWSGLDFPVHPGDINYFSILNNLSIRIWHLHVSIIISGASNNSELKCIFEIDNNTKFINLLLYNGHYIAIRNLNSLVQFTLNLSDGIIVCQYCASCYFTCMNAYEKHLNVCMCYHDNEYLFTMPKETHIIFKNNIKKFKSAICVYADTESILEARDYKYGKSSEYLNEHKSIAIGYVVKKSWTDEIYEDYIYGQDCVQLFISKIKNITHQLIPLYLEVVNSIKRSITKIPLSCSFCKKTIQSKKHFVESTHKIFSGEIIKSHYICFLNAAKYLSKQIKVFFHNLKGYDSHFLIDEIAIQFRSIDAILKSKEKPISITAWTGKESVVFLDSLSFLSGSLASCADKLTVFKWIGSIESKSNLDLSNLKEFNGKQSFPYEYVTSQYILENEELPIDKEKWFSKLRNAYPSDAEINFSLETYKKLNMTSIKDYLMFYLRIDVLLLLEVFESFRDMTLSYYKLDPSNYVTTPGLAWDAALSFTNQSIELLQTKELVEFFAEPGTIRGGISTVSEKCSAEAGSNSSILYYDVTNLYGYAMTFPLPIGEFSWVYNHNSSSFLNTQQISDLIDSWTVDDYFGYVFEVDIHIPVNLHNYFNELPFFPETYNNRLTVTLFDKLNYKTHILVLKQALAHGVKLLHVHRILRFKQTRWLKGYIDFNTGMRAATSDENLKAFFKLMNNAVYGKTMENVFKRSKYILMNKNDDAKIKKYIQRSMVESVNSMTENLLVGKRKQVPIFNKPIYIGFAILEISKFHMYFLFYDVIKIKWPTSQLMYMDTDSFVVNIKTEYSKLEYHGINNHFDLSGYKSNKILSHLFESSNKGVLGTLKDEFSGCKIMKFVCIRSKCYVIKLDSGKTYVKNKGISNSSDITLENFEGILRRDIQDIYLLQRGIKSFNHKVFTVLMNKKALTISEDLKRVRYINFNNGNGDDKYETKAHGHYILFSVN